MENQTQEYKVKRLDTHIKYEDASEVLILAFPTINDDIIYFKIIKVMECTLIEIEKRLNKEIKNNIFEVCVHPARNYISIDTGEGKIINAVGERNRI
jgi:hypothetical protein